MNFLFFKLAFLLSTYADLTSDELITFKESLCEELNLDILNKERFMEHDALRLNYCTEALCEKLSKITSLKELIVYSFDDSSQTIPDSLFNLVNLERLCLELRMSSNITELPEKIANFAMLKVMIIKRTQITSLPESFGSLQSLTHLNINKNKIAYLPESFCSLQSFTHLNMNNNEITSIPESLGSLQSLKMLKISNNKIIFLPISFNKLKSMSHIDLSYNSLEAWPDSEVEFYELQTLDISRNRIKRLPKKLIDFFKNSECFCELNIKENLEFELIDTEDSYGLYSILKILKEKAKISKDLIDKIMQKRDPIPIEIDINVLDLFSSSIIGQIPRIIAEKFKTSRNTILSDAIDRIVNTNSKDFRAYSLPIKFEGELGDDLGGLRNEWFGLVITEFMKQKKNFFSNYDDFDKNFGLVPTCI